MSEQEVPETETTESNEKPRVNPRIAALAGAGLLLGVTLLAVTKRRANASAVVVDGDSSES